MLKDGLSNMTLVYVISKYFRQLTPINRYCVKRINAHDYKLRRYIKDLLTPANNIYYSKFAKDHFFLVKYFYILSKLHKYFCVF